MAAAMNGTSIINAIPNYHGSVGSQKDSAERFLQSMNRTLNAIIPALTEPQRIQLLSRNLRERAWDWFENQCQPPEYMPCQYDRVRILNNWEYFCQAFKKKFFVARDQTSISDDISDVKPRQGEPASMYMDRLQTTLRPVSTLLHERWVGLATARAAYTVPADIATIWQLIRNLEGFPAEVTLNRIHVAVAEACQQACRELAAQLVADNEFLNVSRVAGKNSLQDYARDVIREHMLAANMTFHDLQQLVSARERIKRAPAMSAQAFVAAVPPSNDTSENGGEGPVPVEAVEEDEDDEEVENNPEYVAELAALNARFGKKKKKRGPPQKKGGAKQQQQPRGQKNLQGKPGGQPSNEPHWCFYCQVATHKTSVCRKMSGAKQHYDANPPARPKSGRKPWPPQQQQQQQQGNPRQFQGYGQQQQGYGQREDEPMDVGKTSSAEGQYQQPPNYQHPPPTNWDPIFKPSSGNA
jgi:hypothetical protein